MVTTMDKVVDKVGRLEQRIRYQVNKDNGWGVVEHKRAKARRDITKEEQQRCVTKVVEQGATLGEAAREVGVTERTVRRWRKQFEDGERGRERERVKTSNNDDLSQ